MNGSEAEFQDDPAAQMEGCESCNPDVISKPLNPLFRDLTGEAVTKTKVQRANGFLYTSDLWKTRVKV